MLVGILIIAAGIALLCWKNAQKRKKEESELTAGGHIRSSKTDKETDSNNQRIRTRKIELANSIHTIYKYSPITKSNIRKVWVCRDCETENSIDQKYCSLCGCVRTIT